MAVKVFTQKPKVGVAAKRLSKYPKMTGPGERGVGVGGGETHQQEEDGKRHKDEDGKGHGHWCRRSLLWFSEHVLHRQGQLLSRKASVLMTPQIQIPICLPTCLHPNCVFWKQNHQNLEHGIIFTNTSVNVSPHL